MKELLVDTLQNTEASDSIHGFNYYILVDQMEVNSGFACESYGIKVEEIGGGDVVEIPHITTSASRIDELVELLTRNFVTPTTLPDVIADWL